VIDASTVAVERLTARFGERPQVTIVHAAAGREDSEAEFFEEPDAGLTSSLLSSVARGSTTRRTVKMRSVDSLLAERSWPGIDLLKIDCEGFDYFVLTGAREAIGAQRVGVIQFEYDDVRRDVGATLKSATDLLRGGGLRALPPLLRPGGLYEGWEKFGEYCRYSNFVALSPAWARRERVRGRI
jgi:FkbM family methyltransferase